MIRLLIFDLDGTLFHTGPGIHKAVNHLFKRRGIPEASYEKVTSFIGDGLRKFMQHIGHEMHADEGDVLTMEAEFRQIYKEMFLDESQLFKGVMDFLNRWEHQIAIVSNKDEYFVHKLVENSELKHLNWARVLGGNSLAQKKPHAEPLLEACRAANVEPHQALMIGDGFPDIGAARNAGMKSVAIAFGYTPISELIQAGAHAVLNDYDELDKIVETFSTV